MRAKPRWTSTNESGPRWNTQWRRRRNSLERSAGRAENCRTAGLQSIILGIQTTAGTGGLNCVGSSLTHSHSVEEIVQIIIPTMPRSGLVHTTYSTALRFEALSITTTLSLQFSGAKICKRVSDECFIVVKGFKHCLIIRTKQSGFLLLKGPSVETCH